MAMVFVYCHGTGQYLMQWLVGGAPVFPEKVAEIMELCLPEPLKL